MQIDRSPSRWPYVAVLVCLLVLCLIAPLYWQSSSGRLDDGAPTAEPHAPLVGIDLRWPTRPTLPGYGPDQTLDELLSQLAHRAALADRGGDDVFTELLTIPAEAPSVAAPVAGPRFAPMELTLRAAGQALSEAARRRSSNDASAAPWSSVRVSTLPAGS